MSHELILIPLLESCLSDELNRFKSQKYSLIHELIAINLSGDGEALESKAQKGHIPSQHLMGKSLTRSHEVKRKLVTNIIIES